MMKRRFYFSTAAFPNMITMMNLIAGFFSILMSIHEKFEFAVWFIFLALILDSLDGHVARIFGNETDFGRELDSLADLASFVIAPCVLMVQSCFPKASIGLLAVVVCYLSAGAFRLARFNINPTKGGLFEGLPTPAAALTVSMTMLAFVKNGWGSQPTFIVSAVFLMTAISFLMVSDIPYPKVSAIKFRSWRTLFLVQVFVFFLFLILFNVETAIAFVFLAFIALAPFYCISKDGSAEPADSEREFPCS
jgi:CDP-diacylglycerol--serine O-phosphatidyltransferase